MSPMALDPNRLGIHRADVFTSSATRAGFGLESRITHILLGFRVNRMRRADFSTSPAIPVMSVNNAKLFFKNNFADLYFLFFG